MIRFIISPFCSSSQGAILSAGLQANGLALTKVPKLKLVVIIGGAKFRNKSVIEKAYSSKIKCPSVHFLGDQDLLKTHGTELLDSFVDLILWLFVTRKATRYLDSIQMKKV